MPILPHSSKLEPLQSLLIDLQKSLPQIPLEYQSLAAIELERVVNLLKGWIKKGDKLREHDESAHSQINAETMQQRESWLGLALEQSHSGAWK
jgi:hypothetical protein